MTQSGIHPPVTSLIQTRTPTQRPQPTWDHCEVLGNRPIGDKYYRLTLSAPSITRSARPGQFVMITVPSAPAGAATLPRPMAIHRRHREKGTMEIVYGIKGAGSQGIAHIRPGTSLTVTGPLGVGFGIHPDTSHLLLLGRGIGVCSVMGVAEDAAQRGIRVTAILSGRHADAVIGADDLLELGLGPGVAVTDTDGTSAPEALRKRLLSGEPAQQIMVCGSERLAHLARELGTEWSADVQVSLEAHMACGLGYCHGCASAPSTSGSESALICKDGPVFTLR